MYAGLVMEYFHSTFTRNTIETQNVKYQDCLQKKKFLTSLPVIEADQSFFSHCYLYPCNLSYVESHKETAQMW